MNYKKYKFQTFLAVVGMGIYELIYSYGSRIECLIVLLMAFCLYHYFVKPVTLKRGIAVCLAVGALFSVVEVLRSYDFDVTQARGAVSESGLKPASELGAVYFAGYHLYVERERKALPPKEWPMFFNDFISLVAPNDFVRWNPQWWYARAYYPDSVVPPETLGPIADSAIWGGEIDLFIRSLINGALFAYLVRWFIYRQEKWWAVAVYIFCFATCVLTLKYSIFYHLNPLIKTFVPTIIFVGAARKLFSQHGKKLQFAS